MRGQKPVAIGIEEPHRKAIAKVDRIDQFTVAAGPQMNVLVANWLTI
ncbi:MAG: hypothetical protein R3C05_00655 [Pirellulaceae bacterium]